ncbi:uncharacterized protein LOC116769931 [Danaus plexippus]|uniref:uncharacterized protein LOC116769931 n=1 Tax=Danaus plexippus TaxID=13037 RepID=UPI002AB050A5|nr:uncharacterized protein LOC116769931 [Danaus plexippus]
MCIVRLTLLLLITIVKSQDENDYFESTDSDEFFETTTMSQLKDGEQKMSEYILKVIEHYKQPNPEGLPGVGSQPYSVPDSRKSVGLFSSIDFIDTEVYGINKFRVIYVNLDIENMEGRAALEIDNLHIRGRYALNAFLNSNYGGFTANITGIKITALTTLGVERDGKLRAHDITMDVNFNNIAVNFENSGLLVGLLQGLFNSIGTILFESIKPNLLKEAYTNMRTEINKKIDQVVGDIEFPNTITPLDMVIVDARNKIRDVKMDPLRIDDYNTSAGWVNINLKNTWLYGLSTINRVGNVSLKVENKTVVADFSIGTEEMLGSTDWEISGCRGLISSFGTSSFSVKHIRGHFILVQPLDTRKRMMLKTLELDVGNVQLRFDGAGTLDYLFEFSTNILPNVLRYQIVDAIQNPLKWKLQSELDQIDIEEAIKNELPRIDKLQEEGFQLAMLRFINKTGDNYDEDEFFNF